MQSRAKPGLGKREIHLPSFAYRNQQCSVNQAREGSWNMCSMKRSWRGTLHLPGLCPLVTSPGLDILPLRITDHSHWLCHKNTGYCTLTSVCATRFYLFEETGIDPAHSCVQSDMSEEEHASLILQGCSSSHFRRCPETTVILINVILLQQVRLGPLCNSVSMAIRYLTFYLNYQSRMTLQSMRGRLDPKISRQEATLTPR